MLGKKEETGQPPAVEETPAPSEPEVPEDDIPF